MKMRELAEYCNKLDDCENCNYIEKCTKFKQYLQDCICPGTLLIKGCEKIYNLDYSI